MDQIQSPKSAKQLVGAGQTQSPKSAKADQTQSPKSAKPLIGENYSRRKRPPRRYSTKPTDVYITEKTNFKPQDEKCQQILDSHGEVILHGLGKAVNRTINLALQLQSKSAGTVKICAQTSTVDLTDDFIPESDEGEEISHDRSSSAIHIRIFRCLQQLQSQESESSSGKS